MLSLLATAGISIFKSLVSDHGEDLVSAGIEKVTGVKLKDRTEPLTVEEIKKINDNAIQIKQINFKELELTILDKQNAREHNVLIQQAKDWLVRNTGSIIALITISFTFGLWLYMLIGNIPVTKEPIVLAINSSLTVATGFVLSFYFGSSKTEADSKRS